jgi:hypothetical protein
MATSFSGGGSRREPPSMGKQLVNFITCGCESSAPIFVIYKALQVKWSAPNDSCNVRQSSLLSNLCSNLEQISKTAEEHILLFWQLNYVYINKYITSLTSQLFIDVLVPCQESGRSCFCVLAVFCLWFYDISIRFGHCSDSLVLFVCISFWYYLYLNQHIDNALFYHSYFSFFLEFKNDKNTTELIIVQ